MSCYRLPVDARLLIFAPAGITDIAGRIRLARRSGTPG
jgi:hypothetical protein